jgi:rhodanese-related sulfurtransferase
MTQQIIRPNEAEQMLLKGDAILIDVREIDEYQSEHIKGAVNKPLSTFNSEEVEKLANGRKIIIQCLSGKRASKACAKVNSNNAYILQNGIEGWKENKLATIKKGATINVQRQVMLIAGLLVLIGSLLSIYVNSNYIALPIFIGAGLSFAGLTGWCGMAMLLNKMPWNK